jgi:hypothetical protein
VRADQSSSSVGLLASAENNSNCSQVTATSLTTHQRNRPREPGRRISTISGRSDRADPSGSRSVMLPSVAMPETFPTIHRPRSRRRNRIGSPGRSPSRASADGERCMAGRQPPETRRCGRCRASPISPAGRPPVVVFTSRSTRSSYASFALRGRNQGHVRPPTIAILVSACDRFANRHNLARF